MRMIIPKPIPRLILISAKFPELVWGLPGVIPELRVAINHMKSTSYGHKTDSSGNTGKGWPACWAVERESNGRSGEFRRKYEKSFNLLFLLTFNYGNICGLVPEQPRKRLVDREMRKEIRL